MKKIFIQRSFTLLFSLFLVCFSFMTLKANQSLASATTKSDWELEVKKIDGLIDELKEKQLGYEGKAIGLENQAQRLQFDNGELSLAKKKFQEADRLRALVKEIDIQIEILEKKKVKILNEHHVIPKS